MNTKAKISCDICPKTCEILPGEAGYCGARTNKDGDNFPLAYGKVVALDLDPIEKKPLAFFHPGKMILSVGAFACNMACPFCQNYRLARAKGGDLQAYDLSPKDLADMALELSERGNIGLAFTYNEPTINYEFVRDTFKVLRKEGMETVLVTNGQLNDKYLQELLPLTKAWNIDLKTFSKETYKKLGGDLPTTLNTIKKAALTSHVEVTTLVVPGISDSLEDFEKEVEFLAKISSDLPLHLSRYFPAYKYKNDPTSLDLLRQMKEIAEEKLNHVLLGNVW